MFKQRWLRSRLLLAEPSLCAQTPGGAARSWEASVNGTSKQRQQDTEQCTADAPAASPTGTPTSTRREREEQHRAPKPSELPAKVAPGMAHPPSRQDRVACRSCEAERGRRSHTRNVSAVHLTSIVKSQVSTCTKVRTILDNWEDNAEATRGRGGHPPTLLRFQGQFQ